ncbi:MAG: hypothetical protein MJ252_07220 [archaeon]|nr:hypothetical protein [archaeon]
MSQPSSNYTNLQILLEQNDIVPLLRKINQESKLHKRQMSLVEIAQETNVRKFLFYFLLFSLSKIFHFLLNDFLLVGFILLFPFRKSIN